MSDHEQSLPLLGEREIVARIVDPRAWRSFDQYAGYAEEWAANRPDLPHAKLYADYGRTQVEASLAKADAILSALGLGNSSVADASRDGSQVVATPFTTEPLGDRMRARLQEMVEAIEQGQIDSPTLDGEPEVGIPEHKWHEYWRHYAQTLLDEAAALSLHPSAVSEGSGEAWIKWSGGECPVGPNVVVQVSLRDGEGAQSYADSFNWFDHNHPADIITYRVAAHDPETT